MVAKEKLVSALNLEEMYKLIWQGSYPRLLTEIKMKWELFYDSYISTYLEKDVRTLVNVAQEHNFLKFLKVVAARTGQLLNYSDIANNIGISVNTVKSWISILETSGLIFLERFKNVEILYIVLCRVGCTFNLNGVKCIVLLYN